MSGRVVRAGTISPFGRRGYYLTRTFHNERAVVVSGAFTRVYLVSPAIVAQTIARFGLPGILTSAERTTLDGFAIERRYTVAVALWH